MTHSVSTHQPRSPIIPVTSQWAHEHSGHDGRHTDHARLQNTGIITLTKLNLATVTVAYPTDQQQKLTLSSRLDNIPWALSKNNDVGLFPLWKRLHFILTGTDTSCGYGLAFAAQKACAKTTLCKVTGMFYLLSRYFTHNCFWLRNSLYRKWCVQQVHT